MAERPLVTPRKWHDHARAKELARGILHELEDPHAFDKGPEETDCTPELFDWADELHLILSLYEPHSVEDPFDDD